MVTTQPADQAAAYLATVQATRGEGYCDLSAVQGLAAMSEQLRAIVLLLAERRGLTGRGK